MRQLDPESFGLDEPDEHFAESWKCQRGDYEGSLRTSTGTSGGVLGGG